MTTDNKALAVDVLSILDDAERVLRMDHYKAIADDLVQARAAVAGLIEEAEKIEAFIHRVGMHCKQFSSALARVKGESA